MKPIFRVSPAQFIRYLKIFYKVNLDINKPLALYVCKDTPRSES